MIACLRTPMLQPDARDALLERLTEFTPRIEASDGPPTMDDERPSIVGGPSSIVHAPSSIVYLDLNDPDWTAAVAMAQRIGQVVREQLRPLTTLRLRSGQGSGQRLAPAIGLANGR